MKKILTITFSAIIIFSSIHGQEKQNGITRAYGYVGYGGAMFSGEGYNFGLSIEVNKAWIGTIGQLNAKRKASAPSDANFEHSGWSGSSISHPIAETRFTYISFGRTFPAARSAAFILDAGVGLASGQDFNYYYRHGGTLGPGEQVIPGASSNYTVTKTDRKAVGVIVRGGLDAPIVKGIGMGFDIYYNYCGGGISDNIGFIFRINLGYLPHAIKQ
jgi:hypothetical protein